MTDKRRKIAKKFLFQFYILSASGESFLAGKIYLLGSTKEMPWSYERIYKLDVTEVARNANVTADQPIKVFYSNVFYTFLQDFSILITNLHADLLKL